jgi:hypothetical protein
MQLRFVWGSRDINPGILNFWKCKESILLHSPTCLTPVPPGDRLGLNVVLQKVAQRKFLHCTLVTMLTELAWLYIPQQKRGWAFQTNSVRLLNMNGNSLRDSTNKRRTRNILTALNRWTLCNQHCSTVGQTALTTTSPLNIVPIYNSGSRHLVDTAAQSQSQNFKLHSWPIFAGLPVLNLTGGRRD